MKTKEENLITLTDANGALISVIYRNPDLGRQDQVFYACHTMSAKEIISLLPTTNELKNKTSNGVNVGSDARQNPRT